MRDDIMTRFLKPVGFYRSKKKIIESAGQNQDRQVEVYAAPLSINDEDGQDRVKAPYGADKYNRPVQIKNKYNPTNRFRMNHNVLPTA